jgi:flavin reductase (DIM6/NTAB) family NADH-FMN oxidoreductase RutF
MTSPIVDLFRRLTNGIYVVGVSDGVRSNAFTAAWLTQVSFDPLLLALSIHPGHASYTILQRSRVFSVNVLAAEQQQLARHFGTRSGRETDKLTGMAIERSPSGCPLLSVALAYFDCRVINDVPAGDHRLILGRVGDGALRDPAARPLTYAETGEMDGSAAFFPREFVPDKPIRES